MKKNVLWFILFFPVIGFSHPHIFVDIFFKVQITNQTLKSINVSWVLDEMTSATLLLDYDKNKDGTFSKKETGMVQTDAFDHLQESQYLTYIGIQGKRLHTPKAHNFHLSVEKNRVVYHFTLHPELSIKNKSELKLACYDPENFMAMEIDEKRTQINYTHSPGTITSHVKLEDYEYFVADMLILNIKT